VDSFTFFSTFIITKILFQPSHPEGDSEEGAQSDEFFLEKKKCTEWYCKCNI
jgi:hypothetical protein